MRRAQGLEALKATLKAGQVLRRTDLNQFTKSVDRHLATLVREGHLKKLQQGLYVVPDVTAFGEAPPDEQTLLRSFLKDDHFVVYSFNAFNSLGLGTTQLYNRKVVFNRKRSGEHNVGGRNYMFRRWREAPTQMSTEFLAVEMLNQLGQLAEDRKAVLSSFKENLKKFDLKKLHRAALHYGTYSTQLKLRSMTEGG